MNASFALRVRSHAPHRRRRQGGTVLIIALIVLVAMTLAGIATMRSVDTATILAGNIGLRQATSNAADQGIQAGVNWVFANKTGDILNKDDHSTAAISNGYFSNVAAAEPDWSDPANWKEAAKVNAGAADAAGNVVTYLIHRMCAAANVAPSSTTCASTLSAATLSLEGSDQTRPTDAHTTAPAIHYRITARAVGPRNSLSIVQTMVKAL